MTILDYRWLAPNAIAAIEKIGNPEAAVAIPAMPLPRRLPGSKRQSDDPLAETQHD
jgi:hypothetical protein